eukprot:CAMPEP_0206432854 /NCGR_PEP_ID=MMETSP0324_2-20121206/8198_1 /ASSEMBLY_ACC=CAM_ASM_000836 /TAXON_ID=2866 /ORGANISM="Crypthecodinium cohnii, Strain Seligo" /LENGTH=367 /DNA_ID=CAMNT_0053899033 /DNA_START=10 /DNA_END=1114 /DNA_ORIENTATION=+
MAGAAAIAVATVGGAILLRKIIEKPIAEIATGDQRRKLYPPEQAIGHGAENVLNDKDLTVERKFYVLKDGTKMFYQVLKSADKAPTNIVVFLHGYTSHSELYLEPMAEVARQGSIVIIPDLPCHGRSDGLLCMLPDWWAWVDSVWEFLDASGSTSSKPKFEDAEGLWQGLSLGGGLVVCMAIMRATFFDGIAPMAPLLCVADDVKPPMIVQILFRKLLGPFQLTLPVTPSKDLDHFDFRVPEHGAAFTTANPLNMRGLKPRLATARELGGFTFPEWMEANLKNLKTPLFLMHGRCDKVTDPVMSEKLYNQAETKDKKLQLYDGAYHCELLLCLPGNEQLLGLTFRDDQKQQTRTCIENLIEWISARS